MDKGMRSRLLREVALHGHIEAGGMLGSRAVNEGGITRSTLADALVGIKQRLGGSFVAESAKAGELSLCGLKCPFGKGVTPVCCEVTKAAFTRMAQAVDPDASVVIHDSIADGGSTCRVLVRLPSYQQTPETSRAAVHHPLDP